jgi:hypothetical protein
VNAVFVWTYYDRTGRHVGRSPEFVDRAEAEAWLTRSWEDMHDGGVEEVELLDQDSAAAVYRMGLGEPSETS